MSYVKTRAQRVSRRASQEVELQDLLYLVLLALAGFMTMFVFGMNIIGIILMLLIVALFWTIYVKAYSVMQGLFVAGVSCLILRFAMFDSVTINKIADSDSSSSTVLLLAVWLGIPFSLYVLYVNYKGRNRKIDAVLTIVMIVFGGLLAALAAIDAYVPN